MTNTTERMSGRSRRTDLNLARVTEARTRIPPAFLDTPQFEDDTLNEAIEGRVLVKLECCNPIRSFKGRGVSFALSRVPTGTTVVCASSGNFGQAVAYVGRARGLQVRVYTASTVNPVKRARMAAFGAHVVEVGTNMDDARTAAAEAATESPNSHLITDGVDPAIAEGAATIAEELTRDGHCDTVVVPIGDGSLISGIGLWMRTHAPATRIVGVNPSAAPAMERSFHAGEVMSSTATSGFAEGISVTRPHPESLARVRTLVDDIVLVTDTELLDAMRLIARHLAVLPEPAGAAGLAAVASGAVVGDRVATVVTGANLDPAAITALIERSGTYA